MGAHQLLLGGGNARKGQYRQTQRADDVEQDAWGNLRAEKPIDQLANADAQDHRYEEHQEAADKKRLYPIVRTNQVPQRYLDGMRS
uniref:Uncharacterized protein n=1 Tax=uncultured Desulfobacterium sp. TaxID=201089 RepID=E1YIA9_9BACT|nr:unknown protein [uncultured Desulfobacterium sp.]